MKIDLKTTREQIAKIEKQIINHWILVLTIIAAILSTYAVFKIQAAVAVDSLDSAYEQELASFKSITFDEDVIEKIVKLTERDVKINSKLPNGRSNPFLDF